MANPSEKDSLDDDMTRAGDLSSGNSDPESSLGDLQTGADLTASLSDLAGMDGELEDVGDVVDLSQRYEIVETLGKGGMGEVLLAKDKRLERNVAIKRLLGEYSNSRKAFQRFLTEAKSVAALNHFNIVQIYDFGRDPEGPFLVMELVDGKSLADRLEQGALPLDEAIELTAQLCDALERAHERGIIHRDIKPANILLSSDGTPKLTDFGLARQETADTTHTQAGTVLGTLDYMPPEQRKDATLADARSDQWSLAATFYQMITGEVPRVIDGNAIPEEVRDVVLKSLKSQADDRFATVAEFRDALRTTQSGTGLVDPSQLKDGQCNACGSINDTSRKFCKSCGATLHAPCPNCEHPTAVWERFCGECGTDVVSLIENQISEAQQLRSEVQTLRTNFQHQEALEKLTPLMNNTHAALAEHREWAETTHQKLSDEWESLESQRDKLFTAALEQAAEKNHSAALKYLSQIPESLLTEQSRGLKEQIELEAAELKKLAVDIQQSVKQRSYSGLQTKLTRFLELKPGDEQAGRMLEKLRRRQQREKNQEDDVAMISPEMEEVSDSPAPFRRKSSTGKTSSDRHRLGIWLKVGGATVAAMVMWGLVSAFNGKSPDDGVSSNASDQSGQQTNPSSPFANSPALSVGDFVALEVVENKTATDNYHAIFTEEEIGQLASRFGGRNYDFTNVETLGFAVRQQYTGLVPLYRYRTRTQRRFLYFTEKQNKNTLEQETLLGWVSDEPLTGMVPIYRLWDRTNDQRRFTANDEIRETRLQEGDEETPVVAYLFENPSLPTHSRSSKPTSEKTFDRTFTQWQEVYRTINGSGSNTGSDLTIDIFTPNGRSNSQKSPAIIFFHGGGWRSGSPENMHEFCREFAKRGFVTFAPMYRVRDTHLSTVADSLRDANYAISWVRANADQYGVSPNKIVACGGSAGGQLAAGAALISNYDDRHNSYSPQPNAVVLLNPHVALTQVEGRGVPASVSPDFQSRLGSSAISLSPYHHIKAGAPPMLVLHGTDDNTAPFWTAEKFRDVMKLTGNTCKLVEFPGEGHGFFNYREGGNPNFDRVVQEIEKFLSDEELYVATSSISSNPSTFPANTNSDQDLLQGKWIAVKQEIGGNVWSDQKIRDHKKSIEFTGDQFEIRYQSQIGNTEQVETGTYTLEPDHSPAKIDMRGESRYGTSLFFKGIYQINGDELVHPFVKVSPNTITSRPTRFRTISGIPVFMTTYRREDAMSDPATSMSSNAIFNGRDLTGWKGDRRFWAVENGELVGKTSGPTTGGTFLVYDKPQKDFELKLKFKLVEGNSGVQVRSTDWGNYSVTGPQVDLAVSGTPGVNGSEFQWLGSLTGERIGNPKLAMTTIAQQNRLKELYQKDDWNDLKVRCDGKRCTIAINGYNTIDTDVSALPNSGVIAFQLHGGMATEIRLKDITLDDVDQMDLSATFPGSYEINWKEPAQGTSGVTTYTFKPDGTTFKDEREMGTWKLVNDQVQVDFSDSTRGHVLVTFVGDGRITGTHLWQSGRKATWEGQAVSPMTNSQN